MYNITWFVYHTYNVSSHVTTQAMVAKKTAKPPYAEEFARVATTNSERVLDHTRFAVATEVGCRSLNELLRHTRKLVFNWDANHGGACALSFYSFFFFDVSFFC